MLLPVRILRQHRDLDSLCLCKTFEKTGISLLAPSFLPCPQTTIVHRASQDIPTTSRVIEIGKVSAIVLPTECETTCYEGDEGRSGLVLHASISCGTVDWLILCGSISCSSSVYCFRSHIHITIRLPGRSELSL